MATQARRDYYEILGVDRTATGQEIQNAFQKLANDFHASGRPKTNEDVEWLREIRKAYDVLSDADRRRYYDHLGDDGMSPVKPSGGYDSVQLERVAQAADDELKMKRNYWIFSSILRFFGWAI